MFEMFAGPGMEQMGINMQEMFGNLLPKRTKKRKLPVKEARKVLIQEEAHKLIDMDEVIQESIQRAEQSGIIFIDEIDKIASQDQSGGPGRIPGRRAAGHPADRRRIDGDDQIRTGQDRLYSFHRCRRFPYRQAVGSDPRTAGPIPDPGGAGRLDRMEDFVRILTEPENALTKQYTALLRDGRHRSRSLRRRRSARSATIAAEVNRNTENIGARRLHTILEKLLEDLSFEAPDIHLEEMSITPEYVREKLDDIAQNRDLSQYIL